MAEAAAAKGAPIPSATKEQSPPTAISCLLVDHANSRTLQVAGAFPAWHAVVKGALAGSAASAC